MHEFYVPLSPAGVVFCCHVVNQSYIHLCVAEGGWHVPEEAYLALETLLPTGMGSFLEIWAADGAFRDGWTFVSDPFT